MYLDAIRFIRYLRAFFIDPRFKQANIMNAVMREPYEVPVVANETIEAKLDPLRKSVDEVKADVRSLRDKVDQNFNTLNQGQNVLRDKVDQNFNTLNQGQNALRDKVDANFNTLNQGQTTLRDKIDATRSELTQRIEQVRTELSNDIKTLRTDFGADLKTLRTEFSAINGTLIELGSKLKSIRWFAWGVTVLLVIIEGTLRIGDHFHWF